MMINTFLHKQLSNFVGFANFVIMPSCHHRMCPLLEIQITHLKDSTYGLRNSGIDFI